MYTYVQCELENHKYSMYKTACEQSVQQLQGFLYITKDKAIIKAIISRKGLKGVVVNHKYHSKKEDH